MFSVDDDAPNLAARSVETHRGGDKALLSGLAKLN
jgi:hypothetical protein